MEVSRLLASLLSEFVTFCLLTVRLDFAGLFVIFAGHSVLAASYTAFPFPMPSSIFCQKQRNRFFHLLWAENQENEDDRTKLKARGHTLMRLWKNP